MPNKNIWAGHQWLGVFLWSYLQHNPWQQPQEHHELSAQSQPPIRLRDEVIPVDVEPRSCLHFPSRRRSASGTTPVPESNSRCQFFNWKEKKKRKKRKVINLWEQPWERRCRALWHEQHSFCRRRVMIWYLVQT